jgi:hypothetical protein
VKGDLAMNLTINDRRYRHALSWICAAKVIFVLALLLIFASCVKNDVVSSSDGEDYSSYPTTLHPLSQPDLDSLQKEFDQKLGSQYLAKLDEYGLLGHFGFLTRGQSTITDPNQAIPQAKSALLHLDKFSNIYDTSIINVQSAWQVQADPIYSEWRITFQNQIYRNLEVRETMVFALVTDNFVLLDGHHYSNIYVPQTNLISRQQAKDSLVGKEIVFLCWSPGKYIITDSSIAIDSIQRCIFPLMKGGTIELHVTWKVPVGEGGWPRWYYFIDVITGEIVATEQLFIC